MAALKSVYLVMHQSKPNGEKLLCQVVEAFRAVGITVHAEPLLIDKLGNEAPMLFSSATDPGNPPIEAVIALGGDGTLLRANRTALHFQVPLLGINVGRIGFLAELEMVQLEEACCRLRDDDFELESRMMLEATLEDGTALTALNDVVIHRGGSPRLITFQAWADQQLTGRYIADGIIIATPTGSTGYSLSAGGPIMCPDVDCIILSPICAHSLQHRPVVTSSQQTIVVELDQETRQALLSIDGQDPLALQGKQRVTIRRSTQNAQFIRLHQKNFFNLIRHKLAEWSC